MIIDFHTHAFPEQIAARALDKLSKSAQMPYYLEGTLSDLRASMEKTGITYSVLLPVATSPNQQETINRNAIAVNDRWQETGILSFGGIHPDNEDYRTILRSLKRAGIRGIKIHPVFQGVDLDDIRFLRIIECACAEGLVVLTHAGYDVGFWGQAQATPLHTRRMLDAVHPDKMVLAHMGGWGCWEEVEELLVEYPIWLDTSFALTRVQHFPRQRATVNPASPHHRSSAPDPGSPCTSDGPGWLPEQEQLSGERFLRIAQSIGTDRLLFGSDSPWSDQADSLSALEHSGIKKTALPKILSENAVKLLSI